MMSVRSTGRGPLPTIVGGVACAALALQQLFVALHLAAEDHAFPGAPAGHGHHHATVAPGDEYGDDHGHDHGHDPVPARSKRPDHEPHPVADHLDPLGRPASHRTLVDAPLLLPQELVLVVPSAAPRGCRLYVEADPRPPPPRAIPSPRAPPVVA